MSVAADGIVPGDPDAVLAVAGRIQQIAQDLSDVRRVVQGGGLNGSWTGEAAAEFRATLLELPDDLTKMASAHDQAQSALRSFGYELRDLKGRAEVVARQQEQATARQAAADRASRAASTQLTAAQRSHAAALHDPVAESRARQVVDAATRTVQRVQSDASAAGTEVARWQGEAKQLRDRFQQAADGCRGQVDAACTLSLRERISAGYEANTPRVVKWMFRIMALRVRIWLFLADPSWAEAHKILDDLGFALAIVTIAVAVFVGPEVLLLGALVAITTGIAVVNAVATGVLFSRHEVGAGELAFSVLGVGLAALPVLKVGKLAFNAASKGARTSYFRYGEGYRPSNNTMKGAITDPRNEILGRGLQWVWGQLDPVEYHPKSTAPVPLRPLGAPSYYRTPKSTIKRVIPLRPSAQGAPA